METLDIEKLTEAILQFDYYDNYIKEAKALIRKLPQKEVDKINEETTLHIDRQPQYNYTYSAEYKAEVEKLKVKFPATKEVKENYNITLTTQNATAIRKATEVRKLAENNVTTLRRLSAAVNKAKRK
jgi:uncharacterized protein YxeA